MPDSLKKIEHTAFHFCQNLEKIDFGNGITEIGRGIEWGKGYIFSECKNLKKVVIPEQVSSIGYGAFEGSGLTEVQLSKSITRIGSCAFQNCKDLKQIFIPNADVAIGGGALTSVKEVIIAEGKYLPVNLDAGITSLKSIFFTNLVKIKQGNDVVYFQRSIDWDDYGSLPKRKTLKDLKEFYLTHKMEILQNMLKENMHDEFIEALSMSECNKEDFMSLLKEAEENKNIVLSAEILNAIRKSNETDFSELRI